MLILGEKRCLAYITPQQKCSVNSQKPDMQSSSVKVTSGKTETLNLKPEKNNIKFRLSLEQVFFVSSFSEFNMFSSLGELPRGIEML